MRRLIVLFTLALSGCASSGDRLARDVATILDAYTAPGEPGASVLVRHRGEILFARGFGLADLDANRAAESGTNYRLASVTKQFTAMASLLLVDDGVVRLDDPVSRWLDDLPPWGERVTIRHLLTHTSGVLDYEDLIPEQQTEQVHDRDVLDILRRHDATSFEPGSRYRYSNSGYALLALVVESASRKTFPDFLRGRIFEPLGMKDTLAFVEGESTVRERAFGHSRKGAAWTRTDQSLTSAVLGDGGVYSSVLDLARWDAELERPTLLSAELLAMAFTPATETDVEGVSYGFGWKIGELAGRRTVFHTGSTIGFRNALLRIPEERLTVIVLTNRNEGQPIDQAKAIANLVLESR
ncbi:MAG: serine hydrolase domain-containing protein [Thermoanaerobaculia bacterium]